MSALLHTARQLGACAGPYDTARRRLARLAVPVEVRQACSRAGGLVRAARAGAAGMAAMGRLGGPMRVEPAVRRAVAALGARALNAKLTLAQKRAYGRKGGAIAAARRRARSAA